MFPIGPFKELPICSLSASPEASLLQEAAGTSMIQTDDKDAPQVAWPIDACNIFLAYAVTPIQGAL